MKLKDRISSEKDLVDEEPNFNEIYFHKDKMSNYKEDKKNRSLIVSSESDEHFEQRNNHSSNNKFQEKKGKDNKKENNYQSERVFISEYRKNESYDNNSSFNSKKRYINLQNVINQFSYYMKNKIKVEEDEYSYQNESSIDMIETCLICDEKLTMEEKRNNLLKCLHMFCDDCFYRFIKEKINSNFIQGIKCPYKDCDGKLYENFIIRILMRDEPLLEKYKILQKKRQLMLNPNAQLCPYPDCDSYAIKGGNNKNVKCIKSGHKFCFNCLKQWHDGENCDTSVDNSFEKWRDSYKVKRCPKCKYFIEKNEGCNHITCYNCKYEFCWLCLGEYTSGHFETGRCFGLQDTDCIICSNPIVNFLYRVLTVIVKCLLFGIGLPFIFVFAISFSISEKITDYFSCSDCINILSGISGVFTLLNLIMCLIPLTSSVAVLMLLFWPLQDKIFELFKNL